MSDNSDDPRLDKLAALRARSVSKDYKIFSTTLDEWRQIEKKKLEEKEVEGCTFKPDIKKSSKKFPGTKTTYY